MFDYTFRPTTTSNSLYGSWVVSGEVESIRNTDWSIDYDRAYRQGLGSAVLKFSWPPKKKRLDYSEEDFIALLNNEFEVPADEL